MMRSGIIYWSPTPLLITSGPPPHLLPQPPSPTDGGMAPSWMHGGISREESEGTHGPHVCIGRCSLDSLDVVSLLSRCMHQQAGCVRVLNVCWPCMPSAPGTALWPPIIRSRGSGLMLASAQRVLPITLTGMSWRSRVCACVCVCVELVQKGRGRRCTRLSVGTRNQKGYIGRGVWSLAT
jgi:hypothetical protein